MKIQEALERLDAMSAMAHRVSIYDGLRATPIAATGLMGVLAAFIQTRIVGQGLDAADRFVIFWAAVACLCLMIVLADGLVRYQRDPTARSRRMTAEVFARLAPAIVTGGALAVVIPARAPELIATLPFWWSIVLGLGIHSAAPLLPVSLRWIGSWYIGCGLIGLIVAGEAVGLHPLSMAIPFAGGQMLTAWVIHHDSA